MPLPEYVLHSWLLTAVEALATLAFALSGLLEAARKKLDEFITFTAKFA